ncbi:GNAT family N-acetyltransferase [Eionea flava]
MVDSVSANSPAIHWSAHSIDTLPVRRLLALLQLRQEVFIVEQSCIYSDIDSKDGSARHIIGWDTNRDNLCACLRILSTNPLSSQPLSDSQMESSASDEVVIGRVAVASSYRRLGVGSALMKYALKSIYHKAPNAMVSLSAQYHLTAFYEILGFSIASSPYDEDGIEHVKMIKPS